MGWFSPETGAANDVRHRRAIQSAGVIGNAATPACASSSPLRARRDCGRTAASRRHRTPATAPVARSRGRAQRLLRALGAEPRVDAARLVAEAAVAGLAVGLDLDTGLATF